MWLFLSVGVLLAGTLMMRAVVGNSHVEAKFFLIFGTSWLAVQIRRHSTPVLKGLTFQNLKF